MPPIQSARAVAGFNLTAQRIGFLQPLLAGDHGDNQTYVQRLSELSRIAGFDAVAWPERDTVSFEDSPIATVDGESLWSFLFPNERRPLILPWEQFRKALEERIDNKAFASHPLLQFDVVQTLNLDAKKPDTFKGAFDAYAQASLEIAERWRDRAILETELLEALRSAGKFTVGEQLRAQLTSGIVKIALEPYDDSIVELIKNTCQEITARYGAIFPKLQGVEATRKAPRESVQRRENGATAIILVGKLRHGKIETPDDNSPPLDVVSADYVASYLRRHQPSACFVLGRQSDWRQIVETANNLKHIPSVAVILTAAVEPLTSDVAIQEQLQIPSILRFALSGEYPRSANPLAAIQSLIDILSIGDGGKQQTPNPERMPAKHCLFIREEIRGFHDDANEIGCRIGARAVRAGIHPGARVDIFLNERSFDSEVGKRWSGIFETLFATSHESETILPLRGRRTYLSLLADRTIVDSKSGATFMKEGAVRLLIMRGWNVERTERDYFLISNERRQFTGVVVDRKDSIPAEDRAIERPSFGRSHLLVIHTNANRETLLIGNRGQYSHVTLEDISLMRPDTQWIWPILRRQLNGKSTRASLAALRLSASLAAEAILMGRVYPSIDRTKLDPFVSYLQANDCERFVDFASSTSIREQEIRIRVRVQDSVEAQQVEVDEAPQVEAELSLQIDDDGPILSIHSDYL